MNLAKDPGICLLNMVEETTLPENTYVHITKVLFQTCKLIAQFPYLGGTENKSK